MVLESTMICVDNSDYMRNGDFLPTRLQAQQDAVNLVCHSKTRSNPENNVGLITLANVEVLATLTSDVGRILSKLHQVQPNGNLALITGIRIAHLALKHRQGKNHKMRIVAFVGSPVQLDEKELVKLAKRLKKEKVSVDVISFGEDSINNEVLTAFVNALNGKDGTGSHLVTVPPGPHLSDALISSPIIQGEDGMGAAGMGGAAFEFGVDPNEDPELALALRVSMEEQRQRQEDEARRAQATEAAAPGKPEQTSDATNDDEFWKQALTACWDDVEESSGARKGQTTETTGSGQSKTNTDARRAQPTESAGSGQPKANTESGNGSELLRQAVAASIVGDEGTAATRRAQTAESTTTGQAKANTDGSNANELLRQAFTAPWDDDEETPAATETTQSGLNVPDLIHMSEEEQIALAMQMSMQHQYEIETQKEEAMEVEEDYAAVMSDPAFLQSVLENLPGVDPQSDAVREAVGNLQQKDKDKDKEKKEEKDKDKEKK